MPAVLGDALEPGVPLDLGRIRRGLRLLLPEPLMHEPPQAVKLDARKHRLDVSANIVRRRGRTESLPIVMTDTKHRGLVCGSGQHASTIARIAAETARVNRAFWRQSCC